jgi:hypothetical protein
MPRTGEAIRAHSELRVFVSSTFVDHFAEREVRPGWEVILAPKVILSLLSVPHPWTESGTGVPRS